MLIHITTSKANRFYYNSLKMPTVLWNRSKLEVKGGLLFCGGTIGNIWHYMALYDLAPLNMLDMPEYC